MRKIGIFGGSFDPPHNAHIDIAAIATEQIPLDLLFFVPSYRSPLRVDPPSASARHRLAMLNIITEISPNWEVLTYEVDQKRPVTSYETAKYLTTLEPQASYYLIIGGDQAANLDQWYQWENLTQLVQVVFFSRDNTSPPPQINEKLLNIPFASQLSSSYVRELLKSGRAIDTVLPEAVQSYIQKHRLYQ